MIIYDLVNSPSKSKQLGMVLRQGLAGGLLIRFVHVAGEGRILPVALPQEDLPGEAPGFHLLQRRFQRHFQSEGRHAAAGFFTRTSLAENSPHKKCRKQKC